jgi:hypothetical protein
MGILTHAGLYVFVLEPITERLLGKLKHLKGTAEDRWTRMKMLAFAWAVLLSIAAGTTWVSQMNEGPNFYQTLGCDRQASAREMKRAHRQLSLALHPDKNPSPDAVKQFRLMDFAYKNLDDPRRRARYDVLGLDGVVNPSGATAAVEDSSLLTNILAYYVVSLRELATRYSRVRSRSSFVIAHSSSSSSSSASSSSSSSTCCNTSGRRHLLLLLHVRPAPAPRARLDLLRQGRAHVR